MVLSSSTVLVLKFFRITVCCIKGLALILQNGVVERKHKHLLQVARALMFLSHLPKRFWGESLLIATYIINRLPTRILGWKTPYEVLKGKPSDYSHMKVFDSLCYVTNLSPQKTI